ncbi:hypothetical protein [Nostoc sp.]
MLFFLLPTAELFGNNCALLHQLLDDSAYIAILRSSVLRSQSVWHQS